MRCKFCGSRAIYPNKDHKNFSTGKAIAGAVTFGLVGAAAGFIGKDTKGYRCSACGMFSEQAMDSNEAMLIDMAVSKAKRGTDRVIYERYQEKYANIEYVPEQQVATGNAGVSSSSFGDAEEACDVELLEEAAEEISVKNSYCPYQYIVGCPVFISNVTIQENADTDSLLLDICNISGKTMRSLYLSIIAYDDVGDPIGTSSCVYQGLQAAPGEHLPQDKPFDLKTNIAYKVDIVCEKAAFSDNSVWRKEDTQTVYSLAERTELVPESFSQYKYLRVLLSQKSSLSSEAKLYYPVVEETHRLCICGNPVIAGEKCPVCGLDEDTLQTIMDYDVLLQCHKVLIVTAAKARTDALNKLRDQAQEDIYQQALQLSKETSEDSLEEAAELFQTISGYKNADALRKECEERVTVTRKDKILAEGKAYMSKRIEHIADFEQAIKEFKKIPGWKNTNDLIVACEKKIEELNVKAEAERLARERNAEEARRKAKQKKAFAAITISVVCAVLLLVFIWFTILIPNNKYNDAIALMDAGKYDSAIGVFESLDGYKDSVEKINESKYNKAVVFMDEGKYTEAITVFESLGGYKDSVNKTNESKYNKAVVFMDEGKYTEAIAVFESLGGYSDSKDKIIKCNTAILEEKYNAAAALEATQEIKKAAIAFGQIRDFKDARNRSMLLWDEFADRNTISRGGYHSVAVKENGEVVAVGWDAFPEVLQVSTWKNVIAVSTGVGSTFGLKSDGTVYVACEHEANVHGWTDIVALDNGGGSLAVKMDGTVVVTDDYSKSFQNTISTWQDVVAISSGGCGVAALKADGTVLFHSTKYYGIDVSNWRDIVAISVGSEHIVGLKSNGTVVASGENKGGKCEVWNLYDVVAIGAGACFTAALKKDGTVVTIGQNVSYTTPREVDVTAWKNIVAIEVDNFCILGLKENGSVVIAGEGGDISTYKGVDIGSWRNIKVD